MSGTASEIVDCFAGKYERTNAITRWLMRSFFSAVSGLVPPEARDCLEAGCGPGYSLETLRQSLPDKTWTAFDVEDELVAVARRRNPDATITTESIYEIRQPDRSFDLVLCLEVLEHLERPLEALRELRRVTRGKVLLSVPREPIWRVLNMARGSYWSSLGNTPGHLNHWSSRGFASFVASEFRVLEVRQPLPWTVVFAEVS